MKSEYDFQEQLSKHAEQEKLARRVLNVDQSADNAKIKKAFYVLAKKYHPDKNKGDEEAVLKFQQVLNAYEFLTGVRDSFDVSEKNEDVEQKIGKYNLNEWGYFCHWKEVFMDDLFGTSGNQAEGAKKKRR